MILIKNSAYPIVQFRRKIVFPIIVLVLCILCISLPVCASSQTNESSSVKKEGTTEVTAYVKDKKPSSDTDQSQNSVIESSSGTAVTGDDSNITPWWLLLSGAGITIGVVLLKIGIYGQK